MRNKSVGADGKKAREECAGLGMYDWFDASFFIVYMSTDKLVLFQRRSEFSAPAGVLSRRKQGSQA
jgi:hypothetical protein